MGSWSDDIFGNDLACDVRDEYRDRLKAGDAPDAAIKRVKKEFAEALKESDEKWTVWIALAAVQLENGGVSDDVREKALKGIAWSVDPAKGEELSPYGAKELDTLRKKLGGPEPKAKAAKPVEWPGEKGNVYAIMQKPDTNLPEGVIITCGPVGFDRGPGSGRVVLLIGVKAKDVTPELIQKTLTDWRQYWQKWHDGYIGRGIGYYDATGKLPARSVRLLLKGVEFPESFQRRMNDTGKVCRSADLPWIVQTDLGEWERYDWIVNEKYEAKFK